MKKVNEGYNNIIDRKKKKKKELEVCKPSKERKYKTTRKF